MHLHEEAREAGWDDEQILEAIAAVSLEGFTAMVNVAGEVPVDGSSEASRALEARLAFRYQPKVVSSCQQWPAASRPVTAYEAPEQLLSRSTTRRSSWSAGGGRARSCGC